MPQNPIPISQAPIFWPEVGFNIPYNVMNNAYPAQAVSCTGFGL